MRQLISRSSVTTSTWTATSSAPTTPTSASATPTAASLSPQPPKSSACASACAVRLQCKRNFGQGVLLKRRSTLLNRASVCFAAILLTLHRRLQRQRNAHDACVPGLGRNDLEFAVVGLDDFSRHRKPQAEPDVAGCEKRSGGLLHSFG